MRALSPGRLLGNTKTNRPSWVSVWLAPSADILTLSWGAPPSSFASTTPLYVAAACAIPVRAALKSSGKSLRTMSLFPIAATTMHTDSDVVAVSNCGLFPSLKSVGRSTEEEVGLELVAGDG